MTDSTPARMICILLERVEFTVNILSILKNYIMQDITLSNRLLNNVES
jgi:hypothetical protein